MTSGRKNLLRKYKTGLMKPPLPDTITNNKGGGSTGDKADGHNGACTGTHGPCTNVGIGHNNARGHSACVRSHAGDDAHGSHSRNGEGHRSEIQSRNDPTPLVGGGRSRIRSG